MPIPGNLLSATTESMDPTYWGWRPRLNCTLATGTGGRNGPKCLTIRSSVAGEVQAETTTGYPVTPGGIYYAFADAAGATEPERIGLEWLDSTYTPVGSITWSLTTLTATASWHRVSVAGMCPAGASRVRVVLSSTPTAALVSHFWENVYLGAPIRTGGNLFGFATESTEVDASGWVAEVNASVGRQVPAVSWSATAYTVGGHTLAMTAVAAGNAAARAVDRPAVTPGVEYMASAYLQPPVLTATAWLELRFYDANSNQVGVQRSILAAPGTGMYRQRASMVAPATAASCSVAMGLDGASAGQILRAETVAVQAAPTVQAGSILTYADSSFEQGAGGWTKNTGVATIARSTPWGAASIDGSYSLTVTSTTATASLLRSSRMPAPAAAGLNFRAQIIGHPAAGTWSTVTVGIRWYDAANTDLGVSSGTTYGFPGSGWYSMSTDAVAPAGATQAAVEVAVVASAANSVMNLDSIALWQVLPQTTVVASSNAGYITLTLRELPLDYVLTVHREAADGTRTLVRGPSGLITQQLITSELMVIEDHEAPLGTLVRYRIEVRAATATSGPTRSSVQVSIGLDDVQETWLKDPGNPQRNLRVMVQRAPDWSRPIEQTTHRIRGRRNPVVLSGRRGGLEGDLEIWTRSDEEREALHLLLDSGNTLLWQAMPGLGVDDVYVAVAQVAEARTGGIAQEPWRSWQLPLTQVDMPVTTGVNGSGGRTWQDVVAEFDTWADLLTVYATAEDLLLDRRRE